MMIMYFQYVDYVMTFVQKTVNDETLFPTKEIKLIQYCMNVKMIVLTFSNNVQLFLGLKSKLTVVF